jgi:hypothetical protein
MRYQKRVSKRSLKVNSYCTMAIMIIIAVNMGCVSYRRTAGCAIVASPGCAPELHGYILPIDNKPFEPFPENKLPVVCKPDQTRYVRPVDDLVAISEGGANLDDGFHHVCPPLGSAMTPEAPGKKDKPCGSSACDNVQFVISGDPLTTHLLFYDDPSAHGPSTSTDSHSCYYRLWAIGITWTGRSWE